MYHQDIEQNGIHVLKIVVKMISFSSNYHCFLTLMLQPKSDLEVTNVLL